MSAQGNNNWPHGTRTIIYRKTPEISETQMTVTLKNPDTLEEHTWAALPFQTFARELEIPVLYSRIRFTWGETVSDWVDLEVSGRVHSVVFARDNASGLRVHTVNTDWLGGVRIYNEHSAQLRVTVNVVIPDFGPSEITNIVDPGESVLWTNVGGWDYPSETDLSNWSQLGTFNGNINVFTVEAWEGGGWEEKISASGLFTNRRSTVVLVLRDINLDGQITGQAATYFLGLSTPFLWQYFAPALE